MPKKIKVLKTEYNGHNITFYKIGDILVKVEIIDPEKKNWATLFNLNYLRHQEQDHVILSMFSFTGDEGLMPHNGIGVIYTAQDEASRFQLMKTIEHAHQAIFDNSLDGIIERLS